MKVTPRSRLQYRIQHIIFVLLLFACAGFAGWLSLEYDVRSDWTAGKRHSLSQDTIKLLAQLPDQVELRTYQSDDPALVQAVNEILQRYQDNKKNFQFRLINPDIYIEQARADQIDRYGQTIIEYQGRRERVEQLSEESISNALMRLQRGKQPRLLFIGQHGERKVEDDSAIGYSLLAQRLKQQGFDVASISLLQQEIPETGAVLVLGSGNKPLLESEQDKVLQYIKSGGNLLWLQEPGYDKSYAAIARELQIENIPGVVVDNNAKLMQMLKLSHPAMIPILEYKRHPITENMQYFTLFTTATAIKAAMPDEQNQAAHNDWISTDLLITSDTSWSETGDLLSLIAFDVEQETHGPLSIGRAQQRQIRSEKEMSAQRVVIIGDTDFIANNNLGKGANLDFILKVFNWLTHDDKLIQIAPKDAPDLQLDLSARAASIIGLVFLILLPVSFLAAGLYIRFRRRRR